MLYFARPDIRRNTWWKSSLLARCILRLRVYRSWLGWPGREPGATSEPAAFK